jgi:hypothetical protein
MENYMLKINEIIDICYDMNKSLTENDFKLNVVPGQHINENYVPRYHICIHKNLQEPPIARCDVSFEVMSECLKNKNCSKLKEKLDEALSDALSSIS